MPSQAVVKKFKGLDNQVGNMSSITHADARTRRRAWFGRILEGSFCRALVMIIFYHHRRRLHLVYNTMSTMSALQLSRQLTLRSMRNPQTSLLARSLLASRPASTTSKPVPKGRLLEKPTRFNPPSHPARLPRRNRQPAFQVPLSAKEKEQQRTKQYMLSKFQMPNPPRKMLNPHAIMSHMVLRILRSLSSRRCCSFSLMIL